MILHNSSHQTCLSWVSGRTCLPWFSRIMILPKFLRVQFFLDIPQWYLYMCVFRLLHLFIQESAWSLIIPQYPLRCSLFFDFHCSPLSFAARYLIGVAKYALHHDELRGYQPDFMFVYRLNVASVTGPSPLWTPTGTSFLSTGATILKCVSHAFIAFMHTMLNQMFNNGYRNEQVNIL